MQGSHEVSSHACYFVTKRQGSHRVTTTDDTLMINLSQLFELFMRVHTHVEHLRLVSLVRRSFLRLGCLLSNLHFLDVNLKLWILRVKIIHLNVLQEPFSVALVSSISQLYTSLYRSI
jgi:hypothetical protein